MDIEPCWWCGRDAKSQWFLAKHWVGCSDKFQCGSRGPCADTPEAAIAAWNRVAGLRWRPIETAPRDSISRLIWVPEVQCEFMVSWQEQDDPPHLRRGWHIFGGGWMPVLQNATRWRPLPDPPEPPPIETSGYVEIIGKEPLTEGSDK